MDASKKSLSSEGGTVSWSAEAMLAAGIVAGSLIARVRNPKAALLLAAGALLWRAMKPRQRPAPVLVLPPERMALPTMPREVARPGNIIEATASVEPIPAPVVMEMAPPVPVAMEEPLPASVVEETPALVVTPAPVVASLEEVAMAMPPLVEEDERLANAGEEPSPAIRCDAWILGLEPLPIVEELPLPMAFMPAVIAPMVQEHRPMIAEGAPLPDMIEISVEPAPAGLQMSMARPPVPPMPFVIHEGPIEPALTTPFVPESAVSYTPAVFLPPAVSYAQAVDPVLPVLTEETPLLAVPPSSEASALELFEGFVPAASVDHLVPSIANPNLPAAKPAKTAEEWASFEVPPPVPEPQEPMTLRPMPRVMPAGAGGEMTVGPRKPPVFGVPLPLAKTGDTREPIALPNTENPRRIIPHAPVSTVPSGEGDQQKSWLNFWK